MRIFLPGKKGVSGFGGLALTAPITAVDVYAKVTVVNTLLPFTSDLPLYPSLKWLCRDPAIAETPKGWNCFARQVRAP